MSLQAISLDEFAERYGASAPRRQFLFDQARMVISLLRATGQVRRVFAFGSFVSERPNPNDVDFFVVMAEGFSTSHLRGKIAEVFQNETCRIRYGVDLFWVTEAIGESHIQDMLEVFSTDRRQQHQPTVEIKI
jgi:predicted nucleotidyltransferase